MRSKLKFLVSCLLFVGSLSFLPTVTAAPGDLDSTFSLDGKLFDFFVFGNDDYIYGTAIQADGKIVAGGQATFGGANSCGISRYNTDGTLDPTFDGDGRAIVPSGGRLFCRAMAIQADGKIVAAGFTGQLGTNSDFVVVRFNANGSADTSFDSDGIAITSLGSSDDQAFGVAIQTDGKIVVVGSSFSSSFSQNLGLVRYNTDGSLDSSFGSGGKVTTILGGNDSSEILYAVAIQTDGQIVAAGTIRAPGSSDNYVLARYNTNGSLGGVVTTDVGSSSNDTAFALAIQTDGKIVAAGTSIISFGFPPMSQQEFSLVRYNADFTLDTSFDSDGKVITSLTSTSEQANAIAIQTDGRIVIAGNQNNNGSNENYALARYNANGSLDTSFDSDGMVFTPVSLADDGANSMAIQTDGKIVAGGYARNSSEDFAVVRYNTNGSLDTSFSSDGMTNNDVGFLHSSARAVAIQANGKFVVAGHTGTLAGNDFAVVRYNADGSPDTSFEMDGKVVTSVVSDNDEARAVAVQADGKIVAAGVYYSGAIPHFAVVRYNTDGSLDTSFDSDGIVFTSVGAFDHAFAVAIQADGKIVVAGATDGGTNFDFALVRYNSDGSLDTSFDSDGKVITPVMNFDQALAIAIQPDGKIVAAGRTYNGSNVDFAIVRYNTDGSLDTSFDSDGKVTTPVLSGDDWANAVAVQPDGKIVAAGLSNNGANNDFAVVRYNANGSLDTSFDFDGKATTPVLSGADQANAIAIQANGKIVAAGYTANIGFQNNDFALVRFNPDGSLDATYNADGKASFDFWGSSDDILYGMALDSSGRAVVVGEASGNFAVARILGNAKSPFDYDGDGKADVSVYRPSNNYWYLSRSSDSQFSFHYFGAPDDIPTPADFDGDGKTDLAIFRPSSGDWWYQSSITGVFTGKHWGSNGDIPRPSDFDGDGRADYVVFHPANNYWYRLSSGTGQAVETYFGAAGDKPVIGDFDGDGKSDPAIFRPSTGTFWYMSSIDSVHRAIPWGTSTDLPVPADYDGDGKTDAAVYRPSTGFWYIYFSGTGSYSFTSFGISEDRPVPADYDGDGKADIAVYRPSNGTWYMLRSTAGFNAQQFGNSTDVPTPNAFVP